MRDRAGKTTIVVGGSRGIGRGIATLAAALIAGGLVALPVLAALMRLERSVWDRESGASLIRHGSTQGLPAGRQESAC
jgi:NAD(P)-dependent dehydrogenase (short-subunit alcohol dehydrogenase family)